MKQVVLKSLVVLGATFSLIALALGSFALAAQPGPVSHSKAGLPPAQQKVITPTERGVPLQLPLPEPPGRPPLPDWVRQLQQGGIHTADHIQIRKSANTLVSPDGSEVPNGEFINYSITVTNTGGAAVSLTVLDPLPRDTQGNVQVTKEILINQCPGDQCGVTFEDKSETYRTSDNVLRTAIITSPDTITWFVASLAGGTSQTLQFTVFIDCQPDGALIKNRAFFTGDESGSSNQVQTVVQGGVPEDGLPAISSAPTSCSHPQETANRVNAGDFDRDGDLDIGLASVIGLSIFENSGQGEFELISPFHEGLLAEDVVWADFDNDGFLEVLVVGDWNFENSIPPTGSYSFTGLNYIYKYNGSGFDLLETGDRSYSFQSNDSVFRAAAADYNADGYMDLVTASYWGGCSLLLYKNRGGTTVPFTETLAFPGFNNNLNCLINANANNDGGRRATSVAWGYFDDNTTPDLAVGAGNGPFLGNGSAPYWLRIYTNEGALPFLSSTNFITVAADIPSPVYDLAWGDYNQDGFSDLAVALLDGTILIYRNLGGGGFTATPEKQISPQSLVPGAAVDWADVNRDGRVDLVTAQANGRVQIYDGATLNVIPALRPASRINGQVTGVRSFDADNDGDLEVVATNFNGASALFSAYVPPLSRQISSLPFPPAEPDWRTDSVAWGDIDGDDDLDLLLGASSGEFGSWLYENDDGVLDLAKTLVSGPGPQGLALGDVDNDGDLDGVISTIDEYQLHPNGGGSLQSPNWFVAADPVNNKRSLAWGDADDDGDLDLLIGQNGQTQLFQNDGSPLTETPVYSTPQSGNTRSVAWFDYDKDFFLDFAVGNFGGRTRIYRNIQGETFSLAATLPAAHRTTSIAWGDWDQDGRADLALGNHNEPIRIYERQNNGTWSSVWDSGTLVFPTTSLAWGDWNNDGDFDLAVGNDGQPDQVYENLLADTGTAGLIQSWKSVESARTTGVAWGDVDGDGDLELAISRRDGGAAGIYLNSYVSPSHLVATTDVSRTRPLPNNPTYLSIPRPGTTNDAYFFSAPEILADPLVPIVPVAFTLFDPENDDIIPLTDAETLFEYSLDGDAWQRATGVITTNDGGTFSRTERGGRPYTFLWNANTDAALSEHARFRITIINHLGSMNQSDVTPVRRTGLNQRGSISAMSPPFRVRALDCFWPNDPEIILETPPPYDPDVPINFLGFIDEGSDAFVFTWDFGDVITGIGQELPHIYTDNGTYTVVMTVTSAPCPVVRSLVKTRTVVIGTGVPDELTYLPLVLKRGGGTSGTEIAAPRYEPRLISGAPGQITGLTGDFQTSGLTHLAWQANPASDQVQGYRVYRSVMDSMVFQRLTELPASATSYQDREAACDMAYFITAYNQTGESLPSTASYFTLPCR